MKDAVAFMLTLVCMVATVITGAVLFVAWFYQPAHSVEPINPVRTEYMPCDGSDTDTNCVWDLNHMGEGDGFSFSFFVGEGGHVYRLPHHIAHHLLNKHN